MEELGVMQLKVIEPYHLEDKYPQVEDLVRDAGVLISKSQIELVQEYYQRKDKSKEVSTDILITHLNCILKYVCALMYCFELDLPDEDILQEYVEEEITPLVNSDVILTLFNIQNRISQIVLDYWVYADTEEGFNNQEMYTACMDIFVGIKMICERYSIDFEDLIFV